MKRKSFLNWLEEHGSYSGEFKIDTCELAKETEFITMHIYAPYNSKHAFMFIDEGNNKIKKYKINKAYIEDEIEDILDEKYHVEVRFCSHCGCLMNDGFMQEGGWWYSCNECFREAMNDKFGKGEWRSNLDADDDEPYYEYLDNNQEWLDAEIFWTTWN